MVHLALLGLRAQPYANYLSAVGLLAVLNRQGGEGSQLWFGGDHFHLRTRYTGPDLLDFLLQRYQPSPIISPWNQETGFYSRADGGPLDALARSSEARFGTYRRTISAARELLAEARLTEAPTGESKERLVKSCITALPAEAQPWISAVFRQSEEGLEYSDLLFTGGNDGRFDLSRQYALSLTDLFLPPAPRRARSLLRAVLFDEHTRDLQRATHGFLNPATAESPSAQSGGKAWQQGNPWSLVLALEGLLALAPQLKLRPAAPAGQPSLRPEEKTCGDLWLPLWNEPLTLEELTSNFAQEWPAYQRFSMVARNGRAHFALPSRACAPKDVFWRKPSDWLPNADSTRLWQVLSNHERDPRPGYLARTLEELGCLADDEWKLDARWLKQADDGTAEFELARSLSGLGHELDKKLRVRAHLRHFHGPDLPSRMLSLMRSRGTLAGDVTRRKNRAGVLLYNNPFWSRYPASAPVISSFLRGALDELRVQRLLLGLVLVEKDDVSERDSDVATLPWLYRVAKLACHSDGSDRRPSPPDLALHLSQGRYEQAARIALDFIAQRHTGISHDLPTVHYGGDPRRLAASLLIPISNTTYNAILRSLQL